MLQKVEQNGFDFLGHFAGASRLRRVRQSENARLLPSGQPATDGIAFGGKEFGKLSNAVALCRQQHPMSALSLTMTVARLVQLGQSDLLFFG